MVGGGGTMVVLASRSSESAATASDAILATGVLDSAPPATAGAVSASFPCTAGATMEEDKLLNCPRPPMLEPGTELTGPAETSTGGQSRSRFNMTVEVESSKLGWRLKLGDR
ncbi:hypothetical protein Dimus_024883 [Dionaea muscipula]